MTEQRPKSGARPGPGWVWLLALPVLCCVGHAVLVALGVGSLAAAVGGATGRVALGAFGAVALPAAVAAALVGQGQGATRERAAELQESVGIGDVPCPARRHGPGRTCGLRRCRDRGQGRSRTAALRLRTSHTLRAQQGAGRARFR